MHLLKTLPIFALVSAGLAHPFPDAVKPSPLSKRNEQEGTIGQYREANCAGKVVSDRKDFIGPDGLYVSVNKWDIDPNPYLDKGTCTPWYPYLDQQHGPSVGLDFNTDKYDRIKQVQFFKPTDECTAAEAKSNGDNPPDVCCHKDAGGLLGVINKNGTDSDFGAAKDVGFKGNTCVQLGPGADQTLWQMRYFISR